MSQMKPELTERLPAGRQVSERKFGAEFAPTASLMRCKAVGVNSQTLVTLKV